MTNCWLIVTTIEQIINLGDIFVMMKGLTSRHSTRAESMPSHFLIEQGMRDLTLK